MTKSGFLAEFLIGGFQNNLDFWELLKNWIFTLSLLLSTCKKLRYKKINWLKMFFNKLIIDLKNLKLLTCSSTNLKPIATTFK